jgi:hypothetical protein
MDRDKMSNLYREPSIDASYQISVHLGKWFQRRRVTIFSSESAFPNELKFGRKHVWEVLYKDCSFHPDSIASMAATGNSCFRLVDFKNSSSLLSQLNRNLSGFRGEDFKKSAN